jgi:hypothetical protein
LTRKATKAELRRIEAAIEKYGSYGSTPLLADKTIKPTKRLRRKTAKASNVGK